MKILKLFFTLCLFLSFVSCDSDDDDEIASNAQSIIGSWSMQELEADIDFTTQFGGVPVIGNALSVGENFDFILIFTETTYSVEGSYDLVITTTVNGLPIDEERQSITDISESGTYILNDDGTIELDGAVFDLEVANMNVSDFLGDQQVLTVEFDNNGNLVLSQNIDTTIEEQNLSATVNAQIVLSPI